MSTTPAYLENTTTRVTTENFYWANRVIAALCDGAFADTANAVERYQEKTGAYGHAMVAATDAKVAELTGIDLDAEFDTDDESGDVQPMEPDEIIAAVRAADDVRSVLEEANQALADRLKADTDALLDSVLFTRSMAMKNGFHMSDF